jgi:hypothetical protein
MMHKRKKEQTISKKGYFSGLLHAANKTKLIIKTKTTDAPRKTHSA